VRKPSLKFQTPVLNLVKIVNFKPSAKTATIGIEAAIIKYLKLFFHNLKTSAL
jgi:hypothetical protein